MLYFSQKMDDMFNVFFSIVTPAAVVKHSAEVHGTLIHFPTLHDNVIHSFQKKNINKNIKNNPCVLNIKFQYKNLVLTSLDVAIISTHTQCPDPRTC